MIEYDGESECQFFLSMSTPVACRSHRASSTEQNCAFVDPLYGTNFDLSSLERPEGYILKDTELNSYFLMTWCL